MKRIEFFNIIVKRTRVHLEVVRDAGRDGSDSGHSGGTRRTRGATLSTWNIFFSGLPASGQLSGACSVAMAAQQLTLDASIAIWVVLPLLAFVLVLTYTRTYAMRLLQPEEQPVDDLGLRQRSVLSRAARLRAAGGSISFVGFMMRKAWLIDEHRGRLRDKDVADANPMAMMSGGGQMGAAAARRACDAMRDRP